MGGLLCSALCLDIVYAHKVETDRTKRVNASFQKGSAPPPPEGKPMVPRDKELGLVKEYLTPKKKLYGLITGKHGSGKTTLVLQV